MPKAELKKAVAVKPETVLSTDTRFMDEFAAIQQAIMRRAYEIFEGNGRPFGRALEDWLAAERELIRMPEVDVTEKDGKVSVTMAVAGVAPEDLEIMASAAVGAP